MSKFRKSAVSSLPFALVCLLLLLLSSPAFSANTELDEVRNAIRERGARWKAAENRISRMPKEQRRALCGTRPGFLTGMLAGASTAAPAPPLAAASRLPARLDWRALKYVTPPKDQGTCGSCWAFATTATLESKVAMRTSVLVDLSEQALLSCGEAGDCGGGYIDWASDYLQAVGIPRENCVPYRAADASCSDGDCPGWETSGANRISGWHSIWYTAGGWVPPSVGRLKANLKAYGPLVTTMQVYSDLYLYRSGIYSRTKKAKPEGGHAVQIVGYDDANRCFIVKNSWGRDWGENGFFRIAYSQVNDGYVWFGDETLAYHSISRTSIVPCAYSVSPAAKTFAKAGGAGRITVTAGNQCSWVATSTVPWIKILSTVNGRGSGSFIYKVLPNTGAARVGTLKCRNKAIIIRQR